MSEFNREINGRTASREIFLYESIHAEIIAERNGEKEKVRNRRKADRKYKVLPKVRKQMRNDRGWNRYRSMPCYGCKNIGIAEYRMNNAESVARKDWTIECGELEIINAENRMYAEIEAERLMNLNDWLKYA